MFINEHEERKIDIKLQGRMQQVVKKWKWEAVEGEIGVFDTHEGRLDLQRMTEATVKRVAKRGWEREMFSYDLRANDAASAAALGRGYAHLEETRR